MPSYELVASRDFSVDEPPRAGMTFPPAPGRWKVIRVEEAHDTIYTGERHDEPHVRLVCIIE